MKINSIVLCLCFIVVFYTTFLLADEKPVIGTIREMVSGDMACYIDFTDDQGRRFNEMAGFGVCEDQGLIGQKVRLIYEQANVPADRCAGNPDCPDSKPVRLVGQVVVVTNTGNEAASPKKFEGEFGHFSQGKKFVDFVFENEKKIVFFDAYLSEGKYDDLTIVNKTFGVDSFVLWEECFEALANNEKPSAVKCTGTEFTIDRSSALKDSDATLYRGALKIHGYFVIRGCDGPHQGLMGCTLKPLNVEDVL